MFGASELHGDKNLTAWYAKLFRVFFGDLLGPVVWEPQAMGICVLLLF